MLTGDAWKFRMDDGAVGCGNRENGDGGMVGGEVFEKELRTREVGQLVGNLNRPRTMFAG